ncbi:GntR family transcriptional regulator [Cohnella abietis]|uniref:GntR family transcriptional regulator n=1 Tax=Cohnella abietis TaxID=2507935 RepID=A0A3T1DBI9_9BACL|nr:GntR family transcriptional regulator [Cohnella abietis]BBI35470.1 GntR family transcriptional regulator [Cohnella abietis]
MSIIKRNIMGDTVSRKLRKAIITGKYPDRYHLAEPVLAEEWGMSRGPIRDALQLLVREGFAERLSNGRVCVRKFDEQDIRNLFEFRYMLESFSVIRWIANPSELFAMNEFMMILANMRDLTISTDEFSQWDMLFHRSIVSLSANKSLIQSWNGLEDVIMSILEITNKGNPRSDQIIDHHQSILTAIQEHNADKACALIKMHLDEAEQVMITNLKELLAT